jgi:hypothetical protein
MGRADQLYYGGGTAADTGISGLGPELKFEGHISFFPFLAPHRARGLAQTS